MEKSVNLIPADAETDAIRLAVSRKLSPQKYEHSLRVAGYAFRIAEKTPVAPEKMYVAGLLHDIAGELSSAEILRLSEGTGRYIPSDEAKHAHLLHGIAGSCIAAEEFGIRDEEILSAIAYHSGRVGMQTAEKILFLADMIDHSCMNGYDPARIWQQEDLDSAILAASADMIDFCVRLDLPMGPRTRDSFDYVIEDLIKNSGSGIPSESAPFVEADAGQLEESDAAKRLLEYMKSSVSEEERAWYAAEYLRNFRREQPDESEY